MMLDGLYAQGRCGVGLMGARAADQHDVPPAIQGLAFVQGAQRCGSICPNLVRQPRSVLIAGVRCRITGFWTRETIAATWVSSCFTGTKRIVRRNQLEASKIASALAASVFCRLSKGLTQEGGSEASRGPRRQPNGPATHPAPDRAWPWKSST